ncbi:MAG: cupin domain-containing protein [Acidaminococcaceae bacterium]|jgi:quercetin dioxygenase-like cupin family protein|nr:cupin domain-containing protein [Acidaminococcaceae bacterium]MCI2110645.1 cupin domain-containing protein [Acidaminococcaceae bacterium]
MPIFTEKKKETRVKPTGNFTVEHIIDEKLFGGANKLFAQITLPPGAQVPIHTHQGNNETYYVVKGKGTYTDEDKEYPVEAGNVTFCQDGGTHGLKNTGSDELVFIALIANTMK